MSLPYLTALFLIVVFFALNTTCSDLTEDGLGKNLTESTDTGLFLDKTTAKRDIKSNMHQQRSVRSNSASEAAEGTESSRKCSHYCAREKTVIKNHLQCYYDYACYKIFRDCCPDYVSCCGNQTKTVIAHESKIASSLQWKCVKIGETIGGCRQLGVRGVWMVQTCPTIWPNNECRFRCENTSKRFGFPVDNHLPVVAKNRVTFRNKYCAICNGVTEYGTWKILVHAYVTPPAEYSIDEKIKFIIANDGRVNQIEPKKSQPRRYCIVDEKIRCEDTSHKEYRECLNGPVQVVFDRLRRIYLRNSACALCQGYNAKGWGLAGVCGMQFDGFSMVFHIKKPDLMPASKVQHSFCPAQMVYDSDLEFCRKRSITPIPGILSNQFLIALWLVRERTLPFNSTLVKRHLKRALSNRLSLKPQQIASIQLQWQESFSKYLVASVTVALSPFESQRHKTHLSHSARKKMLTLTRENSTLHIGNSSWPIIKMVVKQLSCAGNKTLSFKEYKIGQENGTIFENRTGKSYLLKNYDIFAETLENITLCPQLEFSDCNGMAYVPLAREEFVVLPDLSIYHNATNQTYEFGNYYVSDAMYRTMNDVRNDSANGVVSNVTNAGQQFLRNSSVVICLPYTREYKRQISTRSASRSHSYFLWILTVCGFAVSIVSLLLFLVIYTRFSELRTIPGKNVMNLCLALLLFQSLWLIRSGVKRETTLCVAVAVLGHYFILVSFVAMSVISYHSCIVFSNQVIVSRPTKSKRQKLFLKYSVIVWVPPAIFVAAFTILDKTKKLPIDYGALCWLGTTNSKIYLFLLPTGLCLLFNMSALIRTAVFLLKHKSPSPELQKRKVRNWAICVKLSTLTGFPWIFAFFGAAFEDVVVFEYLFVIFVCSQGFYIAVAFLWNCRVLELWKKSNSTKRENSTVGLKKSKVATTYV